MNINKNLPVMVTGATGFVAGWIIKKLLENQIVVHAAVRDPKDENKISHLKELAKENNGIIKFFKSDLLQDNSYKNAMDGCEIVFHTASPFTFGLKSHEYVEPALKGTRNVLNSVNNTPSVKKVILTSSCVAIIGNNIDCQQSPNNTPNEDTWNTTSTLDHEPYGYSKTLAEKEAWKINKNQNQWKLVVINPSFVMGPSLSNHSTSGTHQIIQDMASGKMKSGCPTFEVGMVDVRDIATAHFNAAFMDSSEGRNIISNKTVKFIEMSQILRNKFGENLPFPKKTIPKIMAVLLGPLFDKSFTRKSLWRNLSHPWKIDNSKSKLSLNIDYLPIEKSIEETYQQLIDNKTY